MRRPLAAVGAAVVVAVSTILTATPVGAAESITSGAWSGSTLNATPCTTALCGVMQRQDTVSGSPYSITVSISISEKDPVVCATPTSESASGQRSVLFQLSFACNGIYVITAQGSGTSPTGFTSASEVLTKELTVATAPPTVTGVESAADDAGRAITVTWDDVQPEAPDLAGYSVERRIGDGEFTEVATNDADDRTFVDTDLPAEEGDATYRVFAVRPSPTGDKVSAASDEAATPYNAAPEDTTDSTGTGGGATGSGGAGGSAVAGSGDQAASSGGSSAGGTGAQVSPPRLFSGTFLPPLLRPAAQTITTPTTVDTGFDESLPYQQREEDPVLPNDTMASIFSDGQPGRGMAIPVATALVLAIWAFHLRALARAARPTH